MEKSRSSLFIGLETHIALCSLSWTINSKCTKCRCTKKINKQLLIQLRINLGLELRRFSDILLGLLQRSHRDCPHKRQILPKWPKKLQVFWQLNKNILKVLAAFLRISSIIRLKFKKNKLIYLPSTSNHKISVAYCCTFRNRLLL